MDDVLELIAETITKDDYGVERPETSSRTVFCERHSVGRVEFFDGGRNGLNPELYFTVFHGDYAGESICRYRGKTYAIYRTYQPESDYIELYAQREGGTNGK